VKVTDENGPIQRGDLLVTASKPGYAMRYDKWQDTNINVVGIVGIALEPLPVNSGKVLVLVKTGWVQNRTQTIAEIQQDLITIAQSEGIIIGTSGQNLSIGEDQNGQLKQAGGNVDLNGYYIVNVAGLFGENGSWEIDDQGRFVTQVQTSAGKKSLYALQSQKTEYVFSGSATLVNGAVRVDFDTITQDIINKDKPIKVSITLTAEANGVFVESKDNTGFYVRELHGGSSNAGFDWVVIAQRKMSGSEEEEEDTLNSVTGTPEIVPVEPKNTTSTEPLIEEEVIPEKIEESTPEEPEISDEQPVATSTPDQIENQIEPPTPPEEDPLDDGSVVPATSTTEDVVIEAPVQEEPLQKEPVVPTSVEEPPVSDDPGVEEGI